MDSDTGSKIFAGVVFFGPVVLIVGGYLWLRFRRFPKGHRLKELGDIALKLSFFVGVFFLIGLLAGAAELVSEAWTSWRVQRAAMAGAAAVKAAADKIEQERAFEAAVEAELARRALSRQQP